MASLLQVDRWVKGVEYATMAGLLLDFRRYIERDAGAPIERLEVNGALLLSDMCRFLGLDEGQRAKVLGRSAAVYVAAVLDERVSLSVVH